MIIAVDFGGTRIKIGLVREGIVLTERIIRSYGNQASNDWLPLFQKEIQDLLEEENFSFSMCKGMVWALPMLVHPNMKKANVSFGKFDDCKDADFVAKVESLFGLPVLLENDARAALFGEWEFGAGKNYEDLLMITLGTGIGTAVVMDGKPLRGRTGLAGNLGGLSLSRVGPKDSFQTQIAEESAASWVIADLIQKHPDYQKSSLSKKELLDYKAIFEEAIRGDALAIYFRLEAFRNWGILIANLILSFDPKCVILGGGIMGSREVILPGVTSIVEELLVDLGIQVEIVSSSLNESAGLLGCEMVWEEYSQKVALSS